MTGIAPLGVSTLAETGFSSGSGAPGTTITIYGSGFSTVPSNNQVYFNGVLATVVAATSNSLTVLVPQGATSGTITVTDANGTVTSANVFSVSTAASAPTISSFSPQIGTAGSTISLSGNNFQTAAAGDSVSFAGGGSGTVTAATTTSLTVTVPSGSPSGKITVQTSSGIAVSPQDFFVPPVGYTVADIGATARMTTNGSPLTLSIGTAQQIGLVVFDGVANQKLALRVSAQTFQSACAAGDIALIGPSPGSQVLTSWNFCTGLFFVTLPASGTYTLMLAPNGSDTGSVTLNLDAVPPDTVTAVSTSGTSSTATFSTPGQGADFTFAGTAGQSISIVTSNDSLTQPYLGTILNPDGSTLATFSGNANAFFGPYALPQTGTYTIKLLPQNVADGSISLQVYNVPAPSGGAIATSGAAATMTITAPGQTGAFTFSGTAGQSISLVTSGDSLNHWYNATLLNPDGTTLTTFASYNNTFAGPYTLPQTGTYTLNIVPQSGGTGALTLQVYTVPASAGGAISTSGTASTLTIGTPGQTAAFTFSGTAGQRISLVTSGDSLNQWYNGTLLNPDGTTLATFTGSNNAYFGPYALPQTGTYTLNIVPQSGGTGALTVQLYTIPANVGGSIATNNTATTLNIGTPGQGALYTFSGAANQTITLTTSSDNLSTWYDITVLNPDGTTLTAFSGYNAATFGPYNLTQSGTYSIKVLPQSGGTGSLTLQVAVVTPNIVGTIASNGTATTMNITSPGQNASYTFSGTAGQQIGLVTTADSLNQWYNGTLLNPDGTTLATFSGYSNTYYGPYSLAQTGTYTLKIVPQSSGTGSLTLQLYNIPANVGGAVSTDGTATTLTIGTPGQGSSYTFSGTAGQKISLVTSADHLNQWYNGKLLNPDGTTLTTFSGYSNTYYGPYALSQTGTYTLQITPQSGGTGSLTFQIYTIPANVGGTITTDGTAATMTIGTPGQGASYTFSGAAGQSIGLVTTGDSLNQWFNGTLLNPDGTTLATFSRYNNTFIGPYALAQTGTYTLQILPQSGGTGALTIQIYNIPPTGGSVPTNGTATTLNVTVPGQVGVYTFTGTSGQKVTLATSNDSFTTWYDVTLRNPDGSNLGSFSNYAPTTSGPYTLNQTGTYTLTISPQNGGTGSITFTLTGS